MTQASESWGFSWDVNRELTALGAAFWDLWMKMEQQSKDTERNLVLSDTAELLDQASPDSQLTTGLFHMSQ